MNKRKKIGILGALVGGLLVIVIICIVIHGKNTTPVVSDANTEGTEDANLSEVINTEGTEDATVSIDNDTEGTEDTTISEDKDTEDIAIDVESEFSTIEGTEISADTLAAFQTWIDTDYNFSFAMSDYDDVRNMSLEALVYTFNEGCENLNVSNDELMKEYEKSTGVEVFTDVTMYTDAALSAYLTKWAGITTKELLYQDKPTSEKYGVYMSQHGDTNVVGFTAERGKLIPDGRYAIALSNWDGFFSTMYFVESDGGYKVVANKLHTCYFYDWYEEYKESDFIFPHSECSYITPANLETKTQQEIRIARNEIYARHNYAFESEDLKNYFGQFAWYKPMYTSEEFDYNSFGCAERRNLEMIKKYVE